jgi:AcrR family transcriptional regulator
VNLDSSRRRGPKPVRQSLRFQQREAARAGILDAAEELIAAKGLHGAALVDIARRAGVAVGTLYNYFADRDDLVRALFESRRALIRPKILEAIGRGRELRFEAHLRTFVRELLAVYDQHRQFLKVAFEAEHLKPAGNTSAQEMQAAIEEIIAKGVLEDELAAGPSAELAGLAVWGTLKAVVMRRIADGRTLVDFADALVSMILDGARK